jgi:hypothetical protein
LRPYAKHLAKTCTIHSTKNPNFTAELYWLQPSRSNALHTEGLKQTTNPTFTFFSHMLADVFWTEIAFDFPRKTMCCTDSANVQQQNLYHKNFGSKNNIPFKTKNTRFIGKCALTHLHAENESF